MSRWIYYEAIMRCSSDRPDESHFVLVEYLHPGNDSRWKQGWFWWNEDHGKITVEEDGSLTPNYIYGHPSLFRIVFDKEAAIEEVMGELFTEIL